MEEMELVILDSVEPGNHSLLDVKEEEWIHRLRTGYYEPRRVRYKR